MVDSYLAIQLNSVNNKWINGFNDFIQTIKISSSDSNSTDISFNEIYYFIKQYNIYKNNDKHRILKENNNKRFLKDEKKMSITTTEYFYYFF